MGTDTIKKQKEPQKVLLLLKKHYAGSKTILIYSNPWELLVAIILSAQCTDIMVNKVTKKLFAKYKTMEEYANTPLSEFALDIKSTGFYNNKAKNIQGAARLILNKHKGIIPKTMEELLQIPGVARKTANVFLGNAYGIVEGIAVDTHVGRLSQRLGLSANTNPVKIEQDLMRLYEKKDWFGLTYLLIEHGRKICQAKKPLCDKCFLSKICPSAFQFPHFQKLGN
jgi:endonuclease III